jgi:heme/copper-type cytochrome/quinol oxidase subunit 2
MEYVIALVVVAVLVGIAVRYKKNKDSTDNSGRAGSSKGNGNDIKPL